MSVKVTLIVVSVNTEIKVMTVEKKLPTVDYDGSVSLDNLASQTLKRYTNLQAKFNGYGWVDLRQEKVIDSQGTLTVPYTCLIPDIVRLEEGAEWTSLRDTVEKLDQDTLNLIGQASLN